MTMLKESAAGQQDKVGSQLTVPALHHNESGTFQLPTRSFKLASAYRNQSDLLGAFAVKTARFETVCN